MKAIILKAEAYGAYVTFYKKIYKNYPLKKDDMLDFLKSILSGKSVLNKSMKKQVVLVEENGEAIMGAVLACVDNLRDYVQISFFESAAYNEEAFDILLEKAMAFAKEVRATKLSGSLNIHVNYGLGFLASDYGKPSSFGMNYNPAFYLDYFKNTGFLPIEMVTFKCEMKSFDIPISQRAKNRICSRYTVRHADFKRYEEDIEIYTDINNMAFKEHLFYYPRTTEEDYELYKPFKLLLKEENLLFVEREGVPIGFMLWYPDFSELIGSGKKLSVKTWIDYKLLKKSISTFKIVEMGIIPKEQKRGAILALFNHLDGLVKERYDYMESSWILKDNKDSANFGIKWADGHAKDYVAYTRDL